MIVMSLGYYTKDISDDWMKKLKQKLKNLRPSTAEMDKEKHDNHLMVSNHKDTSMNSHNRPTTSAANADQMVNAHAIPLKENNPRMKPISEKIDDDMNIDDIINDITHVLQDDSDMNAIHILGNPKPNMLSKAATFSVPSSSSSRSIDPKSLALPLTVSRSDSIPYPSISCRRITLHLLNTWGDMNYIGLTGIEVIVLENGEMKALTLTHEHIEHVEPRDLSAIGCYDDPRVPENLFNNINHISDDKFMWLIPFTSKSSHYIQFDLKARYHVIGMNIWNYNKPDEGLLRGVREISIECDSQLLGYWICRMGMGYDGVEYNQMIYFHEIFKLSSKQDHPSHKESEKNHKFKDKTHEMISNTLPGICCGSNSHIIHSKFQTISEQAKKSYNYVRYITPAIKQDYEPQMLPSGLLYTITILDNWGDDYFVGLDMIEFLDNAGKSIDLSIAQATVTALPHSLRDLQGYETDQRLPTNLFRRDIYSSISSNDINEKSSERKIDSWLAPISHSMAIQERKASILRNLSTPDRIKPFLPTNLSQYKFYENYYEMLLHDDDIDEDIVSIPRDNKLWIMFRYPITISAIRFYNYSKTPTRGVKDFSIHLDGQLIYLGTLQQSTIPSNSSIDINPQSILFTNDVKQVRIDKDFINYCGLTEQDVLYINERQVMVRSKDMYSRKPSVAAEGVYVDVKNR